MSSVHIDGLCNDFVVSGACEGTGASQAAAKTSNPVLSPSPHISRTPDGMAIQPYACPTQSQPLATDSSISTLGKEVEMPGSLHELIGCHPSFQQPNFEIGFQQPSSEIRSRDMVGLPAPILAETVLSASEQAVSSNNVWELESATPAAKAPELPATELEVAEPDSVHNICKTSAGISHEDTRCQSDSAYCQDATLSYRSAGITGEDVDDAEEPEASSHDDICKASQRSDPETVVRIHLCVELKSSLSEHDASASSMEHLVSADHTLMALQRAVESVNAEGKAMTFSEALSAGPQAVLPEEQERRLGRMSLLEALRRRDICELELAIASCKSMGILEEELESADVILLIEKSARLPTISIPELRFSTTSQPFANIVVMALEFDGITVLYRPDPETYSVFLVPGDEKLFVGGDSLNGAVGRLLLEQAGQPIAFSFSEGEYAMETDPVSNRTCPSFSKRGCPYRKMHEQLFARARAYENTSITASSDEIGQAPALFAAARAYNREAQPFGAAFLSIFQQGCRPFGSERNLGLVYTIGPLGNTLDARGSETVDSVRAGWVQHEPQDFVNELFKTGWNALQLVLDYNAWLADQTSCRRRRPRIQTVRVPIIAGGVFKHPDVQPHECALALIWGMHAALACVVPEERPHRPTVELMPGTAMEVAHRLYQEGARPRDWGATRNNLFEKLLRPGEKDSSLPDYISPLDRWEADRSTKLKEPIVDGTALLCSQEGHIFASAHSWDIIGVLPAGSRVVAAGPLEECDGYSMIPLRSRGAIDACCMQPVCDSNASSSLSICSSRTDDRGVSNASPELLPVSPSKPARGELQGFDCAGIARAGISASCVSSLIADASVLDVGTRRSVGASIAGAGAGIALGSSMSLPTTHSPLQSALQQTHMVGAGLMGAMIHSVAGVVSQPGCRLSKSSQSQLTAKLPDEGGCMLQRRVGSSGSHVCENSSMFAGSMQTAQTGRRANFRVRVGDRLRRLETNGEWHSAMIVELETNGNCDLDVFSPGPGTGALSRRLKCHCDELVPPIWLIPPFPEDVDVD